MKNNTHIPKPIFDALLHVRSLNQTVCIVAFNANGQWLYMDEYLDAPDRIEGLDIGILETAVDAAHTLPAIYQLNLNEYGEVL